MNIKLIYLSRNKNNNIELLVNDYEKKINHFVKFSSFCLKNKSQSNEKSQIIKFESGKIGMFSGRFSIVFINFY